MSEKSILEFIDRFKNDKDTFLNGCCYWFAYILKGRFKAEICYDQGLGHFVGKIGDKYYDVTGEYHPVAVPVTAEEMKNTEPNLYRRIVRWCVMN